MGKSLNKVELIGNLTRDPELRYTPSGTAVCTFGLATNRTWTTDTGEKKEDTEFHRIVAWNKLAELCSQFLVKGRKVYVQGRIATRNWTGQDGQPRTTVEIVIDDMILLDSARTQGGETSQSASVSKDEAPEDTGSAKAQPAKKPAKKAEKKEEVTENTNTEEVNPDDIPF